MGSGGHTKRGKGGWGGAALMPRSDERSRAIAERVSRWGFRLSVARVKGVVRPLYLVLAGPMSVWSLQLVGFRLQGFGLRLEA